MAKDKKIDKSRFKDDRGRFIVQGLFLEDRYNTDIAVYTYADEDKDYKGTIYPSLKRLYLEHADPVEYDFATTNLAGWNHWERLCKNSIVSKHIEEWRNELSLKLASEGVQTMLELATDGKSYQAAKYLADRQWDKGKRGRPSNEEVEGYIKKEAEKTSEFDNDLLMLEEFRKNK